MSRRYARPFFCKRTRAFYFAKEMILAINELMEEDLLSFRMNGGLKGLLPHNFPLTTVKNVMKVLDGEYSLCKLEGVTSRQSFHRELTLLTGLAYKCKFSNSTNFVNETILALDVDDYKINLILEFKEDILESYPYFKNILSGDELLSKISLEELKTVKGD